MGEIGVLCGRHRRWLVPTHCVSTRLTHMLRVDFPSHQLSLLDPLSAVPVRSRLERSEVKKSTYSRLTQLSRGRISTISLSIFPESSPIVCSRESRSHRFPQVPSTDCHGRSLHLVTPGHNGLRDQKSSLRTLDSKPHRTLRQSDNRRQIFLFCRTVAGSR